MRVLEYMFDDYSCREKSGWDGGYDDGDRKRVS